MNWRIRQGRDLQCERHARYRVEGIELCSRHAGDAALALALRLQGVAELRVEGELDPATIEALRASPGELRSAADDVVRDVVVLTPEERRAILALAERLR